MPNRAVWQKWAQGLNIPCASPCRTSEKTGNLGNFCGKKPSGNHENPEKIMESSVIPTIGKTLIWKIVNCRLKQIIGCIFVDQNDVQLTSEQNLHPYIPNQHQAGKRLGTVKNDTKMASCRGTAAWPSPKSMEHMEPSQATHIFVLFACVSSNSCSSTG